MKHSDRPGMVSLRLEPRLRESLKLRARARGIGTSSAVREAIELWLETEAMNDGVTSFEVDDDWLRGPTPHGDAERAVQRTELRDRLERLVVERERLVKRSGALASAVADVRAELASAEDEHRDAVRAQQEVVERLRVNGERRDAAQEQLRRSLAALEVQERQLGEMQARIAELTRRLDEPLDESGGEDAGSGAGA